jgi:O-antigen/teichoic acid export membrane protein
VETMKEIGGRVAVNASVLLLTGMLGKLIQAGFAIYAARALGVQRFGMYILAATFIAFFDALGRFAIRPMAIREIARDREQVERLLSNILVLALSCAALGYVLLLIVVPLFSYEPVVKTVIYLLALTLFPNAVSLTFESSFYGFEKMQYPALVSIAANLLSSSLGMLVLFLGYGLIALTAVTVAGSLGNAGIAAWFIRRRFLRSGLMIDMALWGSLIKRSIPFVVLGMLIIVHDKIDILMLSIMRGPLEGTQAIGYYTPAYSILAALMMLPMNIRMAMIPTLASRHDATQVIRSSLEGSTKFLLAFVSFPLLIITSFFATDVVVLTFGEAYLPTAKALQILGWAFALKAATAPTFALLSTSKRLGRYIPWALGIAVLNVVLNWLLIPAYSFVGASVATLLTETTAWLLRLYLVRQIVGIQFSDVRVLLNLLGPMGITFGVSFSIYVISPAHHLALALIIGVVYVTALVSSRAFTKEELAVLKPMIGRIISSRSSVK